MHTRDYLVSGPVNVSIDALSDQAARITCSVSYFDREADGRDSKCALNRRETVRGGQ
jgi:hypothetical protein